MHPARLPGARRPRRSDPAALAGRGRRGTAHREEAYLALLGAVLGDLFAFRTLQEGRLVQDLLPTPGQEETKSGNSSRSVLDLHTEDAFHPYRCDYLGLLCLRNDDEVPTSYAELRSDAIEEDHRQVLGQPRFLVRPDETHLVGGEGQPAWLIDQPVPLLFGGPDLPYLLFDLRRAAAGGPGGGRRDAGAVRDAGEGRAGCAAGTRRRAVYRQLPGSARA